MEYANLHRLFQKISNCWHYLYFIIKTMQYIPYQAEQDIANRTI